MERKDLRFRQAGQADEEAYDVFANFFIRAVLVFVGVGTMIMQGWIYVNFRVIVTCVIDFLDRTLSYRDLRYVPSQTCPVSLYWYPAEHFGWASLISLSIRGSIGADTGKQECPSSLKINLALQPHVTSDPVSSQNCSQGLFVLHL